MPLYEYECDACGGRFEVIQKFSETTEHCRRCGKGPVRRLMSSPAIQFKGTGWYITDYAQKGKSGGDSSAADGGSAEKKTDTSKSETTAKSETTTSPPASSSTTTKD
jgi:putative FmdB family regulatory protein